jgi:uncharacterized protein YhaN
VFVGVRPKGQRVRVTPGMSAGTRDQLYLALRLATLEHYFERSEPLPFIVDDILIQFDDERTRATLEALTDLSAKTQVILFTHHERVAEEARRWTARRGSVRARGRCAEPTALGLMGRRGEARSLRMP